MTEHELMLMSVLNCQRIDLYAKDLTLSEPQQEKLNTMKRRRQHGEPLQYVIGETEFCGLPFYVDHRVLIPRPETEIMVEQVVQYLRKFENKSLKVLEIGTGSGCIAVSLAKKFPQLMCHAIDISDDALSVAQCNVEQHHVADQVVVQRADVFDFLEQISDPIYDMIISNPPYIPKAAMQGLTDDVKQEPCMALDGGEDGMLFYRLFVKHAPKALKSDGILVCEFWDGQDRDLNEMFDGQWDVEFFKDFSGVNRFFIAQLEEAHAKAYC